MIWIFLFALSRLYSWEVEGNTEYVDLRTGRFGFRNTDLIVKSAEPLLLTRKISGNSKSSLFFSHLFCELVLNESFLEYCACEPDGRLIRYRQSENELFIPLADGYSDPDLLSVRENPLHNRMYLDGTFKIRIDLPNGGARFYKRDSTSQKQYLLYKEKLPNGRYRLFAYDKYGRIKKVFAVSPDQSQTFGSLRFVYMYGNQILVETNDGRRVGYKIEKHKDEYSLVSVESDYCPSAGFLFSEQKKQGRSLSQLCASHTRLLEIEYAKGRVSKLKRPSQNNREGVLVRSFDYRDHVTESTDADGSLVRTHFDDASRLVKVEYHQKEGRLQSVQTFRWDGFSLVEKALFDADGNAIHRRQFSYDAEGNIGEDAFIDCTSGVVHAKRYRYSQDRFHLPIEESDNTGLVIQTSYVPGTDLLSRKFFSSPDGIFKRHFYEYDEQNLLVAEIIDDGASDDVLDISQITQRKIQRIKRSPIHFLPEEISDFYWDGREMLLSKRRLSYDSRGQVIREEHFDANNCFLYALSFSYDLHGNLIRSTDSLRRESLYVYDAFDRVIEKQEGNSPHQIRYSYDASGNRTTLEKIMPGNKSLIESTIFDLKGNPQLIIDAQGRATENEFDSFGHCSKTLMPFVLDASGNAYRPVTENQFDVQGHLIETKNGAGSVLTTKYNATGDPCHVLHPDGTQTVSTYLPNRCLVQVVSDQEGTTRYEYDVQQRMTRKERLSAQGHVLSVELWQYNSFHLLSHTDVEGRTTHYRYDKAGRKIEERAPNCCLLFFYDAQGRVERVHDQTTGVDTHFRFDVAGRKIEEWIVQDSGAIENRTQYQYTAYDQVAKVIRGTDEDQIFYDGQGRKTLHIDPLGRETRFLYQDDWINQIGQKVLQKTTIHPNLSSYIETHDALGRIVKIERVDPDHKPLYAQDIFYDGEGNQARILTKTFFQGVPLRTHLLEKEYDCMHRLIRETEGGKKTVRFTYNKRGLKTKTEKPDGVCIFYQHDELDRLIEMYSSDGSIHYAYKYDRNDAPGQIWMKPIRYRDCVHNTTHVCSYDNLGRLIQETNAFGVSMKWEYDEAGRPISIQLPDQSTIAYRYQGNHLVETSRPSYSHVNTAFNERGLCVEEKLPFNLGNCRTQYDCLDRPFAQNSLWHKLTQQFNLSGEVALVSSSLMGESSYSYDYLSQLSRENETGYSFDSVGNSADIPVDACNQLLAPGLVYDLNGNLIQKEGWTFQYDALDRLIAIESPGSATHYSYDPMHRLIAKTDEKETQYYFYDQDREIGAINSSGQIIQLKVLGASDVAVSLELQGHPYLPVHDLRQNVIGLVCPTTRSCIETYPMNAFGQSMQESNLSPWRFASRRHLEAGLVYFGARFYDPSLKRWLSPDPLGSIDGPNRYAYVLNNPVNRLDRFGLHQDPLFARNFLEDCPVIYPPSPIDFSAIFKSTNVAEALAHFGFIHPHLIVYGEKVHHLASSPTTSFAAKLEEFQEMYAKINFEEGRRIIDHSMSNGINVSRSEFETYIKNASQKFHQKVFVMGKYNPSQGILYDIQRLNDEHYFGCDTPAVIDMRIEIAAKATLCHLLGPQMLSVKELHSEAGTQYCLAFKGLPDEAKNLVRQHILVMALGPTTAVPLDFAFRAVNIYSDKDKTIGFSKHAFGDPGYDIRIVECLTPKKDWTPFAGDHGYMGDTYQKARSKLIENFDDIFGYRRFRSLE